MDQIELNVVEVAVETKADDQSIVELDALALALVGGGQGMAVFA